jgi:hypothetical protein
MKSRVLAILKSAVAAPQQTDAPLARPVSAAPKISKPTYRRAKDALDYEFDFWIKPQDAMTGSQQMNNITWTSGCVPCGGLGARGGRNCKDCGGDGYHEKVRAYTVVVPPGSREGQKLRLIGQAEREESHSAGDVYLRIRFYGSARVFEALPSPRVVNPDQALAKPVNKALPSKKNALPWVR